MHQLFRDGGRYHSKSVNWFLYDNDFRHEKVKGLSENLQEYCPWAEQTSTNVCLKK